MKYVQALISIGLFGWLGYAVLSGTFPGGDGGSSKTRALKGVVEMLTGKFGVTETGLGLIAFGILLALFFLMRRQPAEEYYTE